MGQVPTTRKKIENSETIYEKADVLPAIAGRVYCYKRTTSDGLTYYEAFKAPEAKDEDGNAYERYPSSSDFGFSTALCIRGDERHAADKIAFYMANGFEAGRFRA